MNSFWKWYEANKDELFHHPITRAQQGYVAGLRRAAEIADEFNDPEYVSNIVKEIEAEATRLESDDRQRTR